jgi:hypothetical protein
MRKLLAAEKGERKNFVGIFSRFGKKANFHGFSDQTVLLINVSDKETGSLITDHIWFNYTKGFEKLELQPGARVSFEARIKSYKKGYVSRRYQIDNSRLDYKLSHPTKLSVMKD